MQSPPSTPRGPLYWLFKAAEDGDLEALRAMIDEKGVSAAAQWPGSVQGGPLAIPKGFTALTVAASQGNLDCLRFLLSRMTPAEADLCNGHGDTAISMAAFKGDAEAIKTLLAKAHPNGVREGGSPLISAARMGQIDCLRVLLADPRTSVDRQDENGYTALDGALGAEHFDCVELLAPFFSVAAVARQFQKMLLAGQWGNLDALSSFVPLQECAEALAAFEQSPDATEPLLGRVKRRLEAQELKDAIREARAARQTPAGAGGDASVSEKKHQATPTAQAAAAAPIQTTRAPRSPRSL